MDPVKRKNHQSLKIIISEALMVCAVIVTVTILALVVSGYWINADFEVERQGMLQISSFPTGADIDIDGETSSWLQRTNTSKVLPVGEHTVTLTKEDYDFWSKTINIKEGLLYRLHYPRLFLQNRTIEKSLSTTGTITASLPSSRNFLLLTNNTTKWSLVKLDTDRLKPESLDVSEYFSAISVANDAKTGIFTGEIVDADWDYDATHVLFKIKNGTNIEWVLLDIKNPVNSVNLTKEFAGDFSDVEILDNSSSALLVVQNHNLQKIDVANRSISAVLVENVTDFDHYNDEVVFVAAKPTSPSDYYVGLLKIGDDQATEFAPVPALTKAVISKFYEEKYIIVLNNTQANVYKKDDPTSALASYELSFTPQTMKVGHDGEFITMHSGSQIATIDMEAQLLREWKVEGASFGWIDNDMIYTIADGELIVYDYDGFNRRVIAKNVSSHFPAAISDNKWLYYFSDDNLVREQLVK